MLPGRETVGPLLLMASTPPFIFVLWFLMSKCDGDMQLFVDTVSAEGFVWWGGENSLFPSCLDPLAWKMILGFMALELAFMKIVPGKTFKATVTPKGNVPVYKANGVQSFVLSLALTAGLMYYKKVVNPAFPLDPSLVYDKFGEILAALNVFALVFCVFLTVKGRRFPSTTDSGTNGNAVIDFYWGTELYPRVWGWDIKTFTNCRFGMMYWAVGICCYAYKQGELSEAAGKGFVVSNSMAISVGLQLAYIAKFYMWETGYWCSMDIQHDRAGYYICWGCLVWVPSVYTSQTFFLVTHPVELTPLHFWLNLLVGVAMVGINYDADRQRQEFRKAKGKDLIWGKPPVSIEAKYFTKGKQRTSLLLASGWWGISRHFHYIPEIVASLAWTVPMASEGKLIPFFYVIYLTILLFDRAVRDDKRCAVKYGAYWDEYCELVPYKVIPGIM